MKVKIKRAYEQPDDGDGTRILVDRLWPRGVSKEKAHIDLWLRELGPSTELRKWFGHDPERWAEFRTKYRSELNNKAELIAQIKEAARHGPVTLIYSAHDEEHNDAVVLQELLWGR